MIKYYINNVDLQRLADTFNYKYGISAIACEDGIIVDSNAFDRNKNMLTKSEIDLFKNATYEFCWNVVDDVYKII